MLYGDVKYNELHDRLSDCYYTYWQHGESRPFAVGTKTFDVQATPELSKKLFDKLHGLIFHLREIAFHAENLKQPTGKRIALSKYHDIKDGSGSVVDNTVGIAAREIAKLKAEGIELEV